MKTIGLGKGKGSKVLSVFIIISLLLVYVIWDGTLQKAYAGSTQFSLRGMTYDNTGGLDWASGSGNLSGWRELQGVPYRMEIKNAEEGVKYRFAVFHDHQDKDSGIYGVETVGSPSVSDEAYASNFSYEIVTDSNSQTDLIGYEFTVSFSKSGDYEVEWEAYIASGAHEFPGASLHAHAGYLYVNDVKDSIGKQDVPIDLVKMPSISVTKTADKSSYNVGETVNYSIQVTNDGETDLDNVTVVDSKIDLNINIGSLGAGDIWNHDDTYPVTDSDLPGPLMNTVEVRATPPRGEDLTESASVSVDLQVPAEPGLTIVKEADVIEAEAGDTVNYTITVENTGNVTLSNIAVTDTMLGLNEVIVELAAGASETLTGSYEVQLTDFNNETSNLVNTATASVTYEQEELAVNDDATVTLVETFVADPELTITKDASPTQAEVGDTITYTIIVENTGNVTLNNIAVTDDMLSLNEIVTELAAGASETLTGSYEVQLTDFNNETSNLVNTATASVTYEQEELAVNDDATVTLVETFVADPELTITKDASPTQAEVGDTITYTIIVENTGNVTLNNIAVTDDMLSLNEIVTELAAGASETLTGSYEVQLTDFNNETSNLVNTATASVTYEQEELAVNDDATVTLVETFVADPELTIAKGADVTEAEAGDTVNYTITVENTGNVTLSNIAVTDAMLGLNEVINELAVGASKTLTGSYQVQPEDFNGEAATLDNTAYTSVDYDETTISKDATASVDLVSSGGGGGGHHHHSSHNPTAVDNEAATDSNNSINIDVLANDDDSRGHYLTVIDATYGNHGETMINEDGTITFIPETDWSGSDQFEYTIECSSGDTDTATVDVTVNEKIALEETSDTEEDQIIEVFPEPPTTGPEQPQPSAQPPKDLPNTGGSYLWPVLIGISLIGAGLLLRRKKQLA